MKTGIATKFRLALASLVALFVVSLFLPSPVFGAGSISQGFKTDETNVEAGAIMSHKSASQNLVELANTSRVGQLVGVIGNKPLIELSGGTSEIQVVTNGVTPTFVSDINGTVRTGDKITASPIKGIGMKATEDTQVVGTAQADLEDAAISTQTIKSRDGKTQHVKVALIPLQIDVMYYAVQKDRLASILPSFLQSIANNTAGKNVSPLRVLACSLVLLLGFLTVAIILYSSVRSSITAIGRNPLARSSLLRGLLEVLMTAAGILVITTVMTYFILTS